MVKIHYSSFPANTPHAFLFALMRATRTDHLILLGSFALIIYGEQCKFQNPPLCRFFSPLLLHTSGVKIPSIYIPPLLPDQRQNCSFVYSNFYYFKQHKRKQEVYDLNDS